MKKKNIAVFALLIGLGANPFCPECGDLMLHDSCDTDTAQAQELTEEQIEACEEASEAETTDTEGMIEEPMDDDCDNLEYAGNFKLTWYCPCSQCCGDYAYTNYGITASGEPATEGVTVSSNDFEIGTTLYIEGYGEYVVQDTGNMASGVIDIYTSDHQTALDNGVDYAEVYVVD